MPRIDKRLAMLALAAAMILHLVLSCIGIAWGLPSRADDAFLFPDGKVWPGAKIASLLGTGARLDPTIGADVDLNPIAGRPGGIVLNATDAEKAEIYRRYRLYTQQPDEMTVMMALSGMRPRQLQFDPKLYQYGGVFLYPVGGVIAAAGAVGAIDVHSDATPYLDAPGAFGRFYVAARAYVAAWGLIGALAVFGIACVLAGRLAGAIAALLFVLLPVVVCMSHEAKPHLPGAVLMLLAVYFGLQALREQRWWHWAGLFVCCGAATGTVLSSAPILILIPLVIAMHCRQQTLRQRYEGACSRRAVDYRPVFLRATAGGLIVATFVYAITNPYVVINLFSNRAVLRSNFGNSLAMYEISRVCEGLVRVLQLTMEGATLPILILGVAGCGVAMRKRMGIALPLAIPAALIALQFILIGAGKPDEYGRFGIFYETALVIGSACVLAGMAKRRPATSLLTTCLLLGWCATRTAPYLWSLHADATNQGSRAIAAVQLQEALETMPASKRAVALATEPAPYACPPLDFANTPVVLYKLNDTQQAVDRIEEWNSQLRSDPLDSNVLVPQVMVAAVDDPATILSNVSRPTWRRLAVCESRLWKLPRSRISWANKPIVLLIAN